MNKKVEKKRFSEWHLYFKEKYGKSYLLNVIAFILGFVFILSGLILLFLPGPGLLFIIVGISMVSIVSKKIAVYFDEVEANMKSFFKHLFKK